MIPTTEQVGWLGKVLGPRGVQLLSRIEIVGSDDVADTAHTLVPHGAHWPGCVQVIYPGKQSEDPFIFVHEMAHAYHSIHFPHFTEITSVARAEACALLTEEALAALMPEDPRIAGRREAWRQAALVSEPLALARQISSQATMDRIRFDLPLHDIFELVFFGTYDDDGTDPIRH